MTTTIPAPSVAVIRRALAEFQLPAYDDQVLQIQQYIKILLAWNEKINLTAIRDPLEILYRHFCECMYAAEAIPLEKGRLADVGSGGGFPGLDRKSTRLNSSHGYISYAVFCLKKKKRPSPNVNLR